MSIGTGKNHLNIVTGFTGVFSIIIIIYFVRKIGLIPNTCLMDAVYRIMENQCISILMILISLYYIFASRNNDGAMLLLRRKSKNRIWMARYLNGWIEAGILSSVILIITLLTGLAYGNGTVLNWNDKKSAYATEVISHNINFEQSKVSVWLILLFTWIILTLLISVSLQVIELLNWIFRTYTIPFLLIVAVAVSDMIPSSSFFPLFYKRFSIDLNSWAHPGIHMVVNVCSLLLISICIGVFGLIFSKRKEFY